MAAKSMKRFTIARRMFATVHTRMWSAIVAAFDTLFLRRSIKRQLRATRAALDECLKHKATLEFWIDEANRVSRKDEESARAQLCRLRAQQETIRDRTGFMVGAFIPSSVIRVLNDSPKSQVEAFKRRVVEILVYRSLAGLFHVTAKGNCVAMIFEPVGEKARKVQPVFESDKDGKPYVEEHQSLELQIIQREQLRLTEGAAGGNLLDHE